jgi:hypothetical protein
LNSANFPRVREALTALPRQLTKLFLEQLEREHGGILVHVCCKCDTNNALDSNALILVNEECSTHGQSWHRVMIRQADGSLILAMPLDKTR